MIEVDQSLVVAHEITGGFTFTLASRLGAFLAEAESRYGPRNRNFTILGVEFHAGGPQVWFPGSCGHVIVQLSVSAMREPNRALFQLAHECVHLLDPAAGGGNCLEEGLAADFSLEVMRSVGVNCQTGDVKYDAACALVREMLTRQPDAGKKLREIYGPWRSIKDHQILAVCPGITPAVAHLLASLF